MSQKPNNYLVDLNNYKVVKSINKGGFGVVYLIKNLKTGHYLAAKVNQLNTKKSLDRQLEYISREIGILIRFRHPTIITFYGFSLNDFFGTKNPTILLDYMPKGSLADVLSKERHGHCPAGYNNTKRQMILAGIAKGMMVLHDNFVIHRDLKPGNVLLDDQYKPRITDFGLSKYFDPTNSKRQSMANCGTCLYMAPEVIVGNQFNAKADVYSFGILMFEVVTGQAAYSEFNNKKISPIELKEKIRNGYRPTFRVEVKEPIKELIQQCWATDPRERPSFADIFDKLKLIRNDDGSRDYTEIRSLFQNGSGDEFKDNNSESKSYRFIDSRYCLDDVEIETFLPYIESISGFNEGDKKTCERLNHTIEMMQQKQYEMEMKQQQTQRILDGLEMRHQTELFLLEQKHREEVMRLKSMINQLSPRSSLDDEKPDPTTIQTQLSRSPSRRQVQFAAHDRYEQQSPINVKLNPIPIGCFTPVKPLQPSLIMANNHQNGVGTQIQPVRTIIPPPSYLPQRQNRNPYYNPQGNPPINGFQPLLQPTNPMSLSEKLPQQSQEIVKNLQSFIDKIKKRNDLNPANRKAITDAARDLPSILYLLQNEKSSNDYIDMIKKFVDSINSGDINEAKRIRKNALSSNIPKTHVLIHMMTDITYSFPPNLCL